MLPLGRTSSVLRFVDALSLLCDDGSIRTQRAIKKATTDSEMAPQAIEIA
jgi:hypothetical protein